MSWLLSATDKVIVLGIICGLLLLVWQICCMLLLMDNEVTLYIILSTTPIRMLPNIRQFYLYHVYRRAYIHQALV